MELIFNPCGEFRWTPEGPGSQIHSSHLHVGALGIFSDLLRSVKMLKREWGAESNGKLPHLFIPRKTATWIPGFAMEDLPLGQNCSLGAWACREGPALGVEHWWWWYMHRATVITFLFLCGGGFFMLKELACDHWNNVTVTKIFSLLLIQMLPLIIEWPKYNGPYFNSYLFLVIQYVYRFSCSFDPYYTL